MVCSNYVQQNDIITLQLRFVFVCYWDVILLLNSFQIVSFFDDVRITLNYGNC